MCTHGIKQAGYSQSKPSSDSVWLLRMTGAQLFKRHKWRCMYTKLFYKLFDTSEDGLTAARARAETGLIPLSYVVSITRLRYKGGSPMA